MRIRLFFTCFCLSFTYSSFSQGFQYDYLLVADRQDTLKNLYQKNTCGVNYTHTSIVLGKKMEFYGLPYPGANQPADLTINNIPGSAIIEKAFLWWDETGPDTVSSVHLENPESDTTTFSGTLIGYGTSKCWGIGASAYRADITALVSGNGTYKVSGLPTDTTFTMNDVNGISLFIIYSDPSANYVGNLRIDEGFMMAKFETYTYKMKNLKTDTNAYDVKAFALISDLQDESGTGVKLNHGNYVVITEDYWDFEQKSSFFLPGQQSADFGLKVPNDCANLLIAGIYYKLPTNTLSPTVQWSADTLSTLLANSYQWLLDNDSINQTSQSFTFKKSGTYHVICTNDDACEYSSDTLTVVICQEKIKPNLERMQDSLWTDSMEYSLIWFKDGKDLGIDSVNYYIIPDTTASFWIMASDSFACVAYSDTLHVSFVGIADDISEEREVFIFPNPVKDVLRLKLPDDDIAILTIYNMHGQEVYEEKFPSNTVYIGMLSSGKYILQLHSTKGEVFQISMVKK